MDLLIELIIGLVLFFIFILSYFTGLNLGLKHGKELNNGNIPTLELNPIKAVKTHVESKKEKEESDLISQGLQNIMMYTGEPQDEKR